MKLTSEAVNKGSVLSYFNRVRTALTTAYERRIIERNPANLAKPIRAENAMREFLTLNEVKRLVETKCDRPVLKDAFLFCVLTGFRSSDIAHLTWSEVKRNDVDGWYLRFKQRKTKLLGHKHVVSSERYAHLMDSLKIEAINKLPVLKPS